MALVVKNPPTLRLDKNLLSNSCLRLDMRNAGSINMFSQCCQSDLMVCSGSIHELQCLVSFFVSLPSYQCLGKTNHAS